MLCALAETTGCLRDCNWEEPELCCGVCLCEDLGPYAVPDNGETASVDLVLPPPSVAWTPNITTYPVDVSEYCFGGDGEGGGGAQDNDSDGDGDQVIVIKAVCTKYILAHNTYKHLHAFSQTRLYVYSNFPIPLKESTLLRPPLPLYCHFMLCSLVDYLRHDMSIHSVAFSCALSGRWSMWKAIL